MVAVVKPTAQDIVAELRRVVPCAPPAPDAALRWLQGGLNWFETEGDTRISGDDAGLYWTLNQFYRLLREVA